jgi:hypothetical protein
MIAGQLDEATAVLAANLKYPLRIGRGFVARAMPIRTPAETSSGGTHQHMALALKGEC